MQEIQSIYEVHCSSIIAPGLIKDTRIALATALGTAEAIICSDINERGEWENIHSYYVARMPVDLKVADWDAMEEYRYDCRGELLDSRDCAGTNGRFMGRDADSCRLKVGDMCMAIVNGGLLPGIVASLPPDPETARRILAANGGAWGLDYSDDGYVLVLKGPDRKFTSMHVDTLNVFAPRCKPRASMVRSYTKALSEYRTAPVRLAIRAVSAKARLQSVLDELDMDGVINTPGYPQEILILELPAASLPGSGEIASETVSIVIPLRKVERHLDMVRGGLARLAGKPVSGRGYHLKDSTPKDQWYGLTDKPLHSF